MSVHLHEKFFIHPQNSSQSQMLQQTRELVPPPTFCMSKCLLHLAGKVQQQHKGTHGKYTVHVQTHIHLLLKKR